MSWKKTIIKKKKRLQVKIQVFKFKQIFVSNEYHNQLKYKTSFDDEFEILVTRKERSHVNVERYNLQSAYESEQGLPAGKLKDLLFLCKSNIIPAIYHPHYESFKAKTDHTPIEEEPAGSSESEAEDM